MAAKSKNHWFQTISRCTKGISSGSRKNSLINNKTDFIFANDLTEIHGETHHGYLLSKDGTVEEAQSKSEIAALITAGIKFLLGVTGSISAYKS